jgi:hypothetical protein
MQEQCFPYPPTKWRESHLLWEPCVYFIHHLGGVLVPEQTKSQPSSDGDSSDNHPKKHCADCSVHRRICAHLTRVKRGRSKNAATAELAESLINHRGRHTLWTWTSIGKNRTLNISPALRVRDSQWSFNLHPRRGSSLYIAKQGGFDNIQILTCPHPNEPESVSVHAYSPKVVDRILSLIRDDADFLFDKLDLAYGFRPSVVL